MKLLTILIIALPLIILSAVGGELKLTAPPLAIEQPTIESIYKIEDRIIVSSDKYRRGDGDFYNSFWQLDEERDRLIPLEVNPRESVVAVSENGSVPLIASLTEGNGNKLHINFINQPSRGMLIDKPAMGIFRLTANDNFVFLVFPDRIVEISPQGSTKTSKLEKFIPNLKNDIATSAISGTMLRAVAATSNELILGYDHGEWGGVAYAIQIGKDGLLSNSKKLLSENIYAIHLNSKGNVWIASGMDRRFREAGLFCYDGKTMTTVIMQGNLSSIRERENRATIALSGGERKNSAKVALPEETTIDGIVDNSNDEIILVAAEAGLFSYRIGKPLNSLWRGNLHILYKIPDAYSRFSYPEGIVSKGKRFYVASSSLGVFRFDEINDGKYIPVKQITFKK
jgi:hypothetical protein